MKQFHWRLALASCLSFLLLLSGCQHTTTQADKGLKIETSFYPVYQLVNEIGGKYNTVEMINSTSGIHDYEPSANDIASIENADMFFFHRRNLEGWAKNMAENLKDKNVTVIEAGKDVKMKRVKGLEDMPAKDEDDEVKMLDPHSWLDPILVAQEAQTIANALAKADPNHAKAYQANADKIAKDAKALVEKYQARFDKARQKTFVTQHTAFRYLADRFKLTQLGIAGISNTQEPSAKQLSEVQDFVTEHQVKVIFTEENLSPKVAQVISDATGAKLQQLSPLETPQNNDLTLLANIEKNLEILAKALENQ